MRYVIASILFLVLVHWSFAQEPAEQSYIAATQQTLASEPGGAQRAFLNLNTPVTILEKRGDWVRVSIEGWVREKALASNKALPEESTANLDDPLSVVDYWLTEQRGGKVIHACLNVKVRNNTADVISSWEGTLLGKDPQDAVVIRELVVSDKVSIPAQGNGTFSLCWSYYDALYEVVRTAKEKQIKLSLVHLKLN